jgi:hypothetical protein
MNPSTSLIAGRNTYNPCLVVLRKKGYTLWVDELDERLLWNARRELSAFSAYSPP